MQPTADLCDELGPEAVGMQTGDASINPEGSVICCTAEVLMNRALRQGDDTGADYVVMDEFHYYGDRERGVAWQVPLLTLPRSTFLLMSATLGNPAPIAERLERDPTHPVSLLPGDFLVDQPVGVQGYTDKSLGDGVIDLLSGIGGGAAGHDDNLVFPPDRSKLLRF